MPNDVEFLDGLLRALWERGGTDLILTPGHPPMLRTNSELFPADDVASLGADDTARIVDSLLQSIGREPLGEARELDFAFSWQDLARIRGNAYRRRGCISVALRIIPNQIPTCDMLGLPSAVRQWATLRRGLVLVTGPTGSRQVDHAGLDDRPTSTATRACHILTIEDPIEYVHDHKRSVVNQREVGDDTDDLRRTRCESALREDPDVLLVGEMRDLESIRFALTIAETGHLVFATLHTNDTAQALDRIVDVFPAEQQPQIRVQLASALTRRRLPAADAADRRRPGRRLRGAGRDARRAQPDPRGQDPPAAQLARHGHRRGHADARDGAVRARAGWSGRLRGRRARPASTRATSLGRVPSPCRRASRSLRTSSAVGA